jgi:hypothetical protein
MSCRAARNNSRLHISRRNGILAGNSVFIFVWNSSCLRVIHKFSLEDVLLGKTLSFVLRIDARAHTHTHTSPCSVSFPAWFQVWWAWNLHKSYTGWRGNQLFSSDTDAGTEWVFVQYCIIWVSSCNSTSYKFWAICLVSLWHLLVFLVSEIRYLRARNSAPHWGTLAVQRLVQVVKILNCLVWRVEMSPTSRD